jgi:endo-1,4-beta-xylanase
MRTRFRHIRTLALLVVGVIPFAGERLSLRNAADHDSLLIGAAVRAAQFTEVAYATTLSREFNMVEPEDAMKWWVVRPNRDAFDFRQGDEVVSFAETHAMKVRGHCLLWARNNPEWLAQGHFTPAKLSRLLHDHITRVMKHYAGQVFAWDVVNEALDENGDVRDSIWFNGPGIGFAGKGTRYIEQAFLWAREADPQALLFYNEAEGEGLNKKSDAIYDMVRSFKRRGVPIDGVGLQLHISKLDLDVAGLEANIARLAALGVQVHITELDVSVSVNPEGNLVKKDNLIRQAQIYRSVARACLQTSGCTAIQSWGFTDKYSWIGSSSHGSRGMALPLDRAYRQKPAYDAILEELTAGRNTKR